MPACDPKKRRIRITFTVARLAGLLKRDYSKKGKTLNIADATVAAVAIHHDLPLITDNIKDFPMKQLQVSYFPAGLKQQSHFRPVGCRRKRHA
jgi:hypothetical protein